VSIPTVQQSRQIIEGWVPPRWLDIARDVKAELAGRAIRKPNGALRGRHAGSYRAFVIGNGPSLGTMDLRPLSGEITIGANSFYKHPHSAEVNLKYLCIGDPEFMRDTPRALEWHRLLDENHPKATLLAHPAVLALRDKHGVHAAHELYGFTAGRPASRPEDVTFDLTRPLRVGHMTGSLLEIPLAVFLGVRRIVLIGFDLNHHVDPGRSYHFYGSHEQFPEFDSMTADKRFSYETLLAAMQREFVSHRLLRVAAAERGIEIVNATSGGLLDVYPRVALADELRGA